MAIIEYVKSLWPFRRKESNHLDPLRHGAKYWYDMYREMLAIEVESVREIKELRETVQVYFDCDPRLNADAKQAAANRLQWLALYDGNGNYTFCGQPRCYRRLNHEGQCWDYRMYLHPEEQLSE